MKNILLFLVLIGICVTTSTNAAFLGENLEVTDLTPRNSWLMVKFDTTNNVNPAGCTNANFNSDLYYAIPTSGALAVEGSEEITALLMAALMGSQLKFKVYISDAACMSNRPVVNMINPSKK